jgi:hypothetical protein
MAPPLARDPHVVSVLALAYLVTNAANLRVRRTTPDRPASEGEPELVVDGRALPALMRSSLERPQLSSRDER